MSASTAQDLADPSTVFDETFSIIETRIANNDLVDLKLHTRSRTLRNEAAVFSQGVPYPGSNRAKSGKTYSDGAIICDHS